MSERVLRFALEHYRDDCPRCEGRGKVRVPWPEATQSAFAPESSRDIACEQCALARRALEEVES